MIVIWVVQSRRRTGAGIPEVIESVQRHLEAASERVPEAEGVEPRGKIGLAVPDGFRGVAFRPASSDAGDDSPGPASDRRGANGCGYAHIQVSTDIAIPCCAAQIQSVAELMVQADSADVGVCLFIVVLGQAIPGIPVDPHGFAIEKRKTVVRNVVFVLEKIIEVHLGRCAEPDGERRSDALPAHFDVVAIDDIGSVGHGVQTKSHRRTERLIDVRGAAEVSAAAGAEGPCVVGLELGSLADLVDDPAGGTATEVNGRGSLEHFNALDIEGVAEIGPLIAHAVQIYVVPSVEAAQGEIVALRAAAFPRRDTDAAYIS